MAQFYTNENFPQPAVEELRRLGHDALTTLESGNAGTAIPDEDVLEFAILQKRTLITFNRKHFIRLHNLNSNHPGIIICTVDPDFMGLAHRIHQIIEQETPLDGKLLRVYRPHK